ncbi:hypothetical protein [uncultured Dokdonia sp.]|uniref:hypothetical protein n=1 Tax=uncultured Dokdonia sp. TaxID=575653 RepID=UPI0026059004|nr:hypothetical protein [uncultured Dokdonia sp.]
MINKIYKFTILLLVLLVSCNKAKNKKERIITVNVTQNDTIIKVTKTKIENKYRILGAKKDVSLIIKNNKTLNQINGKFAVGVFEKSDSINKVICYLTDEGIGLPDLSNQNSILKFCLINEYKTTIHSDSVTSQLIETYSEIYGENNGKYLSFVFLNDTKDTIGFQNTFFIDINNRLCTIHYLNKTRENYNELKNMYEEFALKVLE